MRTRDALSWHWSARDLAQLSALACAGAALLVLERVCGWLERQLDADECTA